MSGSNNQILAVILGASTYENAPQLSNPAFRRAADIMLTYLMSNDGLSVPEKDVLWLFDCSYSPNDIDLEFISFLQKAKRDEVTDLLIYYVGHGFVEQDQYFLALRTTRSENHGVSSLSFQWFSKTIERVANSLRTLWIIDACYSAEARRYFQSDNGLIEKQVGGFYSEAGVSLLCSSSATRRSFVAEDGGLPVFTAHLLGRLERGIDEIQGRKLSARDLHKQLCRDIAENPDGAPIPELHSPVQPEGLEVASFPFFPNHKGLNFEFRTEAEVAGIRHWADDKIKTLEDRHAEDEQERRRLRDIQTKEDKRRAEEENRRREEERRLILESARAAEQERMRRRKNGWLAGATLRSSKSARPSTVPARLPQR